MSIASGLLLTFWASLAAAYFRESRSRQWRRPLVTGIVCAVAVICLAAQLRQPSLLGAFERDAPKILHGQWWRLATALLFQDGGLAGGATNIAALLMIGSLAEQVLRRDRWLAVYGLGGLVAEGVGLCWQPVGAGNSVAVCALAGCLCVVRPLAGGRPWPVALRGIAGGAALLLVTMRDIHGAAAIAGAAMALGIAAIGA